MNAAHVPDPLDLHARARQAMLEAGFVVDLPPAAERERRIFDEAWEQQRERQKELAGDDTVRDLRDLLWSSIDNPESRDLDQIEVAEQLTGGDIRLQIAIADVDAFVESGSALDAHAAHNTTSVYTGVAVFPMLPEAISCGATSLLEDGDRLAVVIEMIVRPDGTLRPPDHTSVYRALVRNQAKLTYEAVGAWLEGHGPCPDDLVRTPGLIEQVRLQDQVAERLRSQRHKSGALDFETVEARPVVENGRVVGLDVPRKNRARTLIENFMVAANTTMATLLSQKGAASIQRIVRSPKRWPRIVSIAAQYGEQLPPEPDAPALAGFLLRCRQTDPDNFADLSLAIVKLLGPGEYAVVEGDNGSGNGHFGLAVPRYTHSTAPNRRYADLVVQRMLKARTGSPATPMLPYTRDELARIAAHCSERENAARKVERTLRKMAAAALFGERIGDVFEAVVTGASPKGVYVRTVSPPVEGRVVRGEDDLDVGDRVRVRLIATNVDHGHIDFAHVGR